MVIRNVGEAKKKISMAFGKIDYDHNGKVICDLCGRSFHKMSRHLKSIHKTTAQKYRRTFGLDRCAALMSKQSQINAKERVKRDWDVVVGALDRSRDETMFKEGNKGRTKDRVREQTRKRMKENHPKKGKTKKIGFILDAEDEKIERKRLNL